MAKWRSAIERSRLELGEKHYRARYILSIAAGLGSEQSQYTFSLSLVGVIPVRQRRSPSSCATCHAGLIGVATAPIIDVSGCDLISHGCLLVKGVVSLPRVRLVSLAVREHFDYTVKCAGNLGYSSI